MDGFIFDVDGTLWDSVEVVSESWNLAIKENSDLEPNLIREILQGLFGKTMDEIAAGVFPDLDPNSRRKLMDICFDYENRYLETHPGVYYEGVMDTLKELAVEYHLLIVSNCQCGYIVDCGHTRNQKEIYGRGDTAHCYRHDGCFFQIV